ncbi:MAG: bifunctional folylpolyglutamate synthase/dihydrofolate synthase, partial [Anaerolineae bacterium]|nr:bifunctional folylpolyglutamate synthase/dihydrofolate synthase [Anaerolineae bacterium]
MAWTYEAAIDYLYSFIDYEVRREVRYAPDVMNLDRPLALLEGLGNPQQHYAVIHITGTKGKGSVGANCFAALKAAGLRAGLYSSPHLQDFRERFRAGDGYMSQEEFTELLAEIKPVVDRSEGLTWFEITTALAFLYFARLGLDAVVTEVGLGGRLDATNVVSPAVSVITSLSYDHMHLLGNTLAEIAAEKAGIIKPGVPVVSAPQQPEAEAVLRRIAAERGAPLIIVGQDWQYEFGATDRCGQAFKAAPTGAPLHDYWTPLIGHHQVINGVVALAALDVVRQAGLPLPPEVVAAGLRRVDWPGRFEIVSDDPWLVFDAAHNGASASCLRETLQAVFPDASRVVVLFGASADKDVHGMFTALLPAVDDLLLVQAVHPRALSPDELAAQVEAVGYTGNVERIPVISEALARARELAGADGV